MLAQAVGAELCTRDVRQAQAGTALGVATRLVQATQA